jgi:hypothetical protein
MGVLIVIMVLVGCQNPAGSGGGGGGSSSGGDSGSGGGTPASVSVTELGTWDEDGSSLDDIEEIAAEGDALFATDTSFPYNLYGVDMGTPSAPTMGTAVSTVDVLRDYALSGNYLYIADGSELFIYDVSTPTTPSLEGSYDHSAQGTGIARLAIAGDYAYLRITSTSNANRTLAIDISQKDNPSFADSIVNSGSFSSFHHEIVVVGNVAYYDANGDVTAIDISDPTDLAELGETTDIGNSTNSLDDPAMIAADGHLFVPRTDEIDVVSVSDPANLQVVDTISLPDDIDAIAAEKQLLYATYWENPVGQFVASIDISDPQNARIADEFQLSGFWFPEQLVATGNRVYLHDQYSGEVRILTLQVDSTLLD